MTLMSSDYEKKKLLSKFTFPQRRIHVCCVWFGIDEVMRKVRTISSLRNIGSRRMQNKIAYEIVYDIRKLYTDFLISFDSTVDEIEFEADNPTVMHYLRDGGLHVRSPSNTHKIADCIAHANGKRFRLDGNVVEWGEDFRNAFHGRVIKALSREKKN